MAKKARMANIPTMRGINIFKDGIPGASETDEIHQSERPEDALTGNSPQLQANRQMAESSAPEAKRSQAPETPPKPVKDEKKTLRSYHLSESLISKLEDAHMVYSLKKIDKSKQDIVAEALEKHLTELEQQGFFQVLDLLRN